MNARPAEPTHVLIKKFNELKMTIQELEKNEELLLSLNEVASQKDDMETDLDQKA